MPLRRTVGSDADALEALVAHAERQGEKVVQVVGNLAGWAILTEARPQRAPREKRA
jgi:hypothetical protein